MAKPPEPEDIIRITCIDKPTERIPGEGLYRWEYLHDNYTLDLLTLERELKDLDRFAAYVELIVSRLQNFGRVYLNLQTGEMIT